MTSVERLVDELDRAWGGDPWHGSALGELLSDVTSTEARHRPITSAHSIWEIVLHLTAWANEVQRRALGAAPAEPLEGDWPATPSEVDDARWQGARDALGAAHDRLRATVAGLDARALDTMVGPSRDQPLGSGVPLGVMLHGVAQHDAYHAGQIALLKKMLRA